MFTWMAPPGNRKGAKVLILTGSLGHGHVQTAAAIQEMMRLRYGNHIEIHIVDYLQQSAPHLHSVGTSCFIHWLKHFPAMYGALFELTRKDRILAHLIKSIRLTSLRPLSRLIREIEPTLVVSTFPAATAAISKLRERNQLHCPTATVITDHTDHSFWIYPYIDLYLVGSNHAKSKLEQQGVLSHQIEVTGIPVRPQFYSSYNKVKLRSQHGFIQDKLTVLLMGGGCGLFDPDILTAIEQESWAKDLQFIVVCGSNTKMQQHLQQWAERSPLDVHIKGYISNIHEYMAMSDLMISKSGGVTTAEALAQRLPLIVYKPLPGQEQDNIEYLMRTGLACQAKDIDSLLACLHQFVMNPEKLNVMRQSAEQECPVKERDCIQVMMQLQHTAIAPVSRQFPSWFRRPVG